MAGLASTPCEGFPVPGEEALQGGGLLPFPREGDVAQFDLEGLLEPLFVRADQLPPLPVIPQQDKEDAAVHPFEGLLHLLAGDDAAVVLAQDHVDGLPELLELNDALAADDQDDEQQPPEPQGKFLTKSDHVPCPPYTNLSAMTVPGGYVCKVLFNRDYLSMQRNGSLH